MAIERRKKVDDIIEQLYDDNAMWVVLSFFINDLSLFDEYKFIREDTPVQRQQEEKSTYFLPARVKNSISDIQQKIYDAIQNLRNKESNSKSLSVADIRGELKDELDDIQFNRLEIYIEANREQTQATFIRNLNIVRNYTYLRIAAEGGSNIPAISYSNLELIKDRIKNGATVDDIKRDFAAAIQHLDNSTVYIQSVTRGNDKSYEGMKDLLESLKVAPESGLPLCGDILNYAARGCRKGKFYLYSSNSGGGKSRTMVSAACHIAFPYIDNNGDIIGEDIIPCPKDPLYEKLPKENKHAVLYITTEQQKDEIQTMILAYISGVNEEDILLHNYSEELDKDGKAKDWKFGRIRKALGIMSRYQDNFYIRSIPNPSISSLKAMITDYIIMNDVQYIFYDYIFTSTQLVNENKDFGLREDVVLMMMSNTLKEIAAEYNVFVMSGTQLSGMYEGKKVRNATMIRGSKAVADKVDLGMIGVRLTDEERAAIQPILPMNKRMPNIVIDIYKNRRGKLCDVKVFRYFDYGTLRVEDVLITSGSYSIDQYNTTDSKPIQEFKESQNIKWKSLIPSNSLN